MQPLMFNVTFIVMLYTHLKNLYNAKISVIYMLLNHLLDNVDDCMTVKNTISHFWPGKKLT